MRIGKRIIIVGGGPAGLAAARAYREEGGQGSVVMLTAESLAPYRRPPLTKEYLRGEVERDELLMQDKRWFAENGVELRLATNATVIDRDRRTVETEAGEEIPYDALVLATGSERAYPHPQYERSRHPGDANHRELDPPAKPRRPGEPGRRRRERVHRVRGGGFARSARRGDHPDQPGRSSA